MDVAGEKDGQSTKIFIVINISFNTSEQYFKIITSIEKEKIKMKWQIEQTTGERQTCISSETECNTTYPIPKRKK